jgi:hypothetical protein
LDLSPTKSVKTPLKTANKNCKIPQKATRQQQASLLDPTHLLKMRLEACQQHCEQTDQVRDENLQNGTTTIMPLPIHPLFRHFRMHNG